MVKVVYTFSHCGNNRAENQDFIHYSDTTFALADGMGGHLNGAAAANLMATHAVKMCDDAISDGSFCCKKITQIFSGLQAKLIDELPESGTTLNIVVLAGTEVFCAHVGDSRTCILTDGEWSQIGTDQNLAAKTGLASDDATLTNCLGACEFEAPQPISFKIGSFEAILLSSDGFYHSVDLMDVPTTNIDQSSIKDMEQQAHSQKPDDDYSAIVLSSVF